MNGLKPGYKQIQQMKKVFILLLLLPLLAGAQENSLSIERIFGSADFAMKYVPDMQMYPMEGYYTTNEFNTASSASCIVKHGFKTDNPDTILNCKKVDLPTGFALEEYHITPSCNLFLLGTNTNHIYRHSNEAEYYVLDKKAGKVHKINEGKKVFYARISPDEKNVAFVYKNNLFIQNLADESITQVTNDGEMNKIINGKSDWVYEEEFVVVQAFFWSPSGDKIAFYKFDESKVKEVELPKYDSSYFSQYKYKYPKAGEDNSKVSIWVYHLDKAMKEKLDLHEENDQYIPRIKWTKENNILSVQRMNRMQNNLEILLVTWPLNPPATTMDKRNSASPVISTLYTEQNNTYIEITDNLYFLKDNSFLITSEKDGYNQIFHCSKDGKKMTNITPQKYDVTNITGVDEKTQTIYFQASNPGPLVKCIYSVKPDGSKFKPLINGQDGQNNASFSSGFGYFILSNTSYNTPLNVHIYSINGKKLRTLEENSVLKKKFESFNFVKKEFIKIPLSDSLYLNAAMIKPNDMIADKKYPVMFSIYGGPGSQQVTNAWGGGLEMWYRYLASHGIIVVIVDNRGTGGRGTAFKNITYKRLGQIESDDQIAAAKWLATQSYVDGSRIGMYGWSFGGYMSSMCITKGADAFKLAVAVAPVTNWKFYDNIYTERYMQRPVDNMKNYEDGSVMAYVDRLKGKFLLIHGTFDDNVHPQNSFMLINEMIRQNKKYDSEFYPNKSHGISGGMTRLHLYNRITDYILQNL